MESDDLDFIFNADIFVPLFSHEEKRDIYEKWFSIALEIKSYIVNMLVQTFMI